ncbi:MAG: hypothetical protein AAGF11_21225 [Myxococcota bacterium]
MAISMGESMGRSCLRVSETSRKDEPLLTLYLSSLVVGGVFVGLSSVGAFGREVDVSDDGDFDADIDGDFDADAGADAGQGNAMALADGSHGLAPTRRKLWLPVMSFRFWTFGAAFFGLAGTLLTTLTGLGTVAVAAASTGTGVGVGSLSAWLVRWLRRPVGESVRLRDYSGQVAELVLPLREGGVSRIKLRVQERERTMLAVAPEPLALPAGTRVVVLNIDESGKAQIAPEGSLLGSEE